MKDGDYVIATPAFIYLLVCQQNCTKSFGRVRLKFSGKIRLGQI